MFEINSATGAISLAAGQSLDYEDGQQPCADGYGVTDGPGLSDDVDVTINVTDVNEQPAAPADFAVNAAENVNDTTVLATVTGTDPDLGGDDTNNFEDLSYSITGGNGAGLFEINSATGAISLAAGESLDYEDDQQHVLTVTVSDGPGLSDTVDVTINVTDVNEQPAAPADFAVNAAENVNDTTVLATVTGTDPDFGGDDTNNFEDLSYSITGGNGAGLFEINSATGAISLAAGQSLDYEDDQHHVLTVTVSDGPGLSDTVDVTINVTDVDENAAPTPANDIVLKNWGDTAFTVPEWAFLYNDTDPDGDPLDISGVSDFTSVTASHTAGTGTNGTILINGDSTVSGPSLDGTFQYAAFDGTTSTNATVTVTQDSNDITGTSANQIFAGDGGGDDDEDGDQDTFTGGGGNDVFLPGDGFDDASADPETISTVSIWPTATTPLPEFRWHGQHLHHGQRGGADRLSISPTTTTTI